MDGKNKSDIIRLYDSGLSYSQIHELTGRSYQFICNCVKGRRSHKDAVRISRETGRWKLTESGMEKLVEHGKSTIRKSGKIWTKPEVEFKNILNSIGLGVIFPEYVQNLFGVKNDLNGTIYYQYPIQRYTCDFVDVANKKIFRVQGDFWHANPLLYDESKLTKIQKFNVGRDKNSKTFFEKNDWIVIDVWESEIYWNVELVKQKIQATRKTANPSLLHSENTEFNSQVAYSDWENQVNKLWFKSDKVKKKSAVYFEQKCLFCNKTFLTKQVKKRKRKYCSHKCASLSCRKVERPSKEDLLNLLKITSWKEIGRKFNVSDNAVRKWAKGYGII